VRLKIARRDENECAYCAEEITPEAGVIGQDWKVYCSEACAKAGELVETIVLSPSEAAEPGIGSSLRAN